jgi:branched-chain amino acid transport system permease protein
MLEFRSLIWGCKVATSGIVSRIDAAVVILLLLGLLLVALMFSSPIHAQIYLNGILLGGLYAVVALGLSLTFGVMKVLNLAHGEFMILGAYLSFWVFTLLGIDPFLSIPIVVPLLFLAGLMVERVLLESVVKIGGDPPIVITFGLVLVMQTIFDVLWTADSRSVSTSYSGIRFVIGPISVSLIRVAVLAVAAGGMAVLYFFLTRTFVGKAMRATALDWKAAEYMGINIKKMYRLTFAGGTAFAGLSGALLSCIYAFEPTTGMTYLMKAIAVTVMAGVGNIAGILVSGLILGAAESVGSYFVGSEFRDAVAFLVFFVVLFIRPTGLFRISTW